MVLSAVSARARRVRDPHTLVQKRDKKYKYILFGKLNKSIASDIKSASFLKKYFDFSELFFRVRRKLHHLKDF